MAYLTSNLDMEPQAMTRRKRWLYDSQDSQASITASSYITDAVARGMAAGDQVIIYSPGGATPLYSCLVKTVRSSVSSGSADLSSGASLST